MRGPTSAVLSVLLAVGPVLQAAPSTGVVQGTVTVEGRPLSGLDLTLVDIASGAIHRARSDAAGGFKFQAAAGRYVVTTGTRAGLAIAKAPPVVAIEAGRVASLSVDMVAVPTGQAPAAQTPPAPAGGGTNIQHDTVGCLLAGEFPQVDADIQPAASVARARLYFKSAASEYYYSEMTLVEGVFRGFMPKPTLAASPITYYISATTTEFGESRTPEAAAIVVENQGDCGELKPAAIGVPPVGLTFFSAATGAAVSAGALAGFAAGGLAIAGGTVALIAAAGAAVAAGVAVAAGGSSPSPVAVVTPSPTPTPPPPAPTPPATPFPVEPTTCPGRPLPYDQELGRSDMGCPPDPADLITIGRVPPFRGRLPPNNPVFPCRCLCEIQSPLC